MMKGVQLREKEALRKFLINRRSKLGPSIDFQSNILNNIKPVIEEIENEYIGTYISFRDELDTKKIKPIFT
jgi:5-formyltetrahydrofolate cyclo-ligase